MSATRFLICLPWAKITAMSSMLIGRGAVAKTEGLAEFTGELLAGAAPGKTKIQALAP